MGRYLTLGWAIILSTGVAFILVKPIVFNWSIILALKIIVSLTTGSMLSMWFAELITNENLGNGSSLIIFINIIGGLPANFNQFISGLGNLSIEKLILSLFVYFLIVILIVLVQDSYKRVNIVSAKQLNFNYTEQSSYNPKLKKSYIPIKLN